MLARGRHEWTLILTSLVWMIPAALTGAGLPEIASHSELDLAVEVGDTLKLFVRPKDEKSQVRWFAEERLVCKGQECSISTASMPSGSHLIRTVVYNREGSRELTFRLKLLAPTPGHTSATIEPPMVSQVLPPSRDRSSDLYARTLEGNGFAYSHQKVQVLGSWPRMLEWNESLRGVPGSVLEWGRARSDTHFLLGEGQVTLSESDNEQRIIRIDRGILRSRNLLNRPPLWSVRIGDWLELDGDEKLDLLVERDPKAPEQATITVWRGVARVRDTTHMSAFKLFPAGSRATFNKGQSIDVPMMRGYHEGLGGYFSQTTPHLMPDGKSASTQYVPSPSLLKEPIADDAEAVRVSGILLLRRDFVGIIEALLARSPTDPAKKVSRLLLLGEAYRGLFIYGVATHFYQEAQKVDPSREEAVLGLAEIALDTKAWSAALELLAQLDAESSAFRDAICYGRGVAAFHERDFGSARGDLLCSKWESPSPRTSLSAADFLRRIEWYRFFYATGALGMHYDGNVLRTTSDTHASVPIPSTGLGWMGSVLLGVRPWVTDSASFSLEFDLTRKAFLNDALTTYEHIAEGLALPLRLRFGDDLLTPDLEARIAPAVRIDIVGEHRVLDRLGAEVEVGSPSTSLSPQLRIQGWQGVDPLPAEEDKLDPVTNQYFSGAVDRSLMKVDAMIEATLIKFTRYSLLGNLGYKTETLTSATAASQSKNTLGVGVKNLWRYSGRFDGGVTLGLDQGAFPDSTVGREDQTFRLQVDARWFYSPYVFQSVGLTFENNTSPIDTAEYQRLTWWILFGLEI